MIEWIKSAFRGLITGPGPQHPGPTAGHQEWEKWSALNDSLWEDRENGWNLLSPVVLVALAIFIIWLI